MAAIDGSAVLAFVAGIAGTVAAFGAKYAFDFRLAKRRLELDERGALAAVLAGRPGQLRRSALRLSDRIEALFRDSANLPSWLAPASTPAKDGYFLRSTVQRVFLLISWGALMQQAIDALPVETVRVRRDLQALHVLLDLIVQAMTSIGMFNAFPDYPTDRAAFNMFTGTIDELADLGTALHNSNSQVIPTAEFANAYERSEPALMATREFVSSMRSNDARSAVITARFACISAILERIAAPASSRSFSDDRQLASRLRGLTPAVSGYDLAGRLPAWLDAECGRLDRP